MKNWNDDLAIKWNNMVWPSRPSVADLYILKNYANKLRKNKDKKLKMLVLGSTAEYRDFAFEESIYCVILDKSEGYHNTINREIRHKEIIGNEKYEKVYFGLWEEMAFENEFDLIVGDLVVGNIDPNKLETLLQKISRALKPNGLFIQKNIFRIKRNEKNYEQAVKQYYTNYYGYHSYSYLNDIVAMHVCDDNNVLHFSKLYDEYERLYKNNIIKKEEFDFMKTVGMVKNSKFTFYFYPVKDYLKLAKKYFKLIKIEYGNDVDSKYMPIYILRKK